MSDFVDMLSREWPVLANAPALSFALVAVGAVAAWWFRGRSAAGEIAGLNAQVGASDQRRLLSEERLAIMTQKEEALEARVFELQMNYRAFNNEMRSLRPSPAFFDASDQTESAIKNVAIATSDLSGSIRVLRQGVEGEVANPDSAQTP
jgi:hypothetical protein